MIDYIVYIFLPGKDAWYANMQKNMVVMGIEGLVVVSTGHHATAEAAHCPVTTVISLVTCSSKWLQQVAATCSSKSLAGAPAVATCSAITCYHLLEHLLLGRGGRPPQSLKH